MVETDDLGTAGRAVREPELQLLRSGGDVRVREGITVGREHDARPGTRRPTARGSGDADHRWPDVLDHADDGARIGVERRVVAGWRNVIGWLGSRVYRLVEH